MTYTKDDLDVRIGVAAFGLASKASKIAKRARFGSSDPLEDKKLQICLAQLDWARTYQILSSAAEATINITGDGGTDTDTYLTVDGVQISNTFTYTTDNATTASLIADAVNDYASTPEYVAVVRGTYVEIKTVIKDSSKNGLPVLAVGGDITFTSEYFNKGKDGVEPEDNFITEAELTCMFDNIAEFTGCCYAPLGYNYKTETFATPEGVTLTLSSGAALLYNTSVPIRLNTLKLINTTI